MVEISICIGSSCHLKGSYNVIQTLQQMVEEKGLHDKLSLKATFCMNECQNKQVSVSFLGRRYSVAPEDCRHFFETEVLPALT